MGEIEMRRQKKERYKDTEREIKRQRDYTKRQKRERIKEKKYRE